MTAQQAIETRLIQELKHEISLGWFFNALLVIAGETIPSFNDLAKEFNCNREEAKSAWVNWIEKLQNNSSLIENLSALAY